MLLTTKIKSCSDGLSPKEARTPETSVWASREAARREREAYLESEDRERRREALGLLGLIQMEFLNEDWVFSCGEGDAKTTKKKFITREQEPEQYWQTAGEREGENPMKTPLPYIIIFGMSTPFVILAIAFANGWIKVPIR
ncbi:hypothetical protein QJS10_CPB17g02096 [Acorus calamus]|uniref:Uncharacterized protein n=1 Tax=Acorus calamus TaxID=4465 RepID=A0AAV9CT26_ACOCL|nr:hypothetical protein QJS10_CPB17g02096 [Acorus calamus]